MDLPQEWKETSHDQSRGDSKKKKKEKRPKLCKKKKKRRNTTKISEKLSTLSYAKC